ncbi:shikimate dehydrogenase [Phytomonospora endophytica]|uniref:Shikimate dehydrogenase n=1 Tax=Phytomonospora endophytica TaxID=714109 RepID=A0A841G456_9ACTN|nr:shikimate dehydrogenase [Phytomonospora endophytica]MBB6039489.1 shikimate dehydrogenase [Phytomonospora endophytica]GIG70216.1 shikimate 5-dehydrogenase [Phytomonospora endophytica]
MTGPVRKAAVLGSPVTHSLSPVIHNAGYAAAGLTGWVYDRHELTADRLPAFLDGLDVSWAGLSLTMPLKEAALDVADEVSPTARAIGAANTLVLREGGRFAENTDAPGMVDALLDAGIEKANTVAVLGAGGTARAAVAAAVDLGASDIVAYARRPESLADLTAVATELGAHRFTGASWTQAPACSAADLVISTVPRGVADDLAVSWGAGTTLFDVLYDPWPTPLAAGAIEAGCVVVDGLALLLAQAVRQFELFTGVDAPVEAMRAALREAVAAR